MSKIGILTFPNSPSFGASLQMFALYKTLEKMGLDVEVINYINPYMKAQKHISAGAKNMLKNRLAHILNIHGRKEFRGFEKQIKLYPNNAIYSKENLTILGERYDYLICGSDQVWNPYVTGGDMSYFFDFCNENYKKISYAASFGVCELSQEFANKVKEEISKFYSISVRENEAIELVRQMTDKEVKTVLDPSMLLEKEQWLKQQKKIKRLPKHYIAKFIFNSNPQIDEFARQLSIKTNIPVINIGGHLLSFLKKEKYTGPIGPGEWLYAIRNADYVITDSFHGAAFSLIFERELYMSMLSSTNSRLRTLADTFKLDNRIIGNNGFQDQKINYIEVNKIMDEKRKDSLKFLKESVLGDV